MNTRLSEIVSEIGDARTTLYGIVEELSQKELDERPDPGLWSAGEILHHLYLVETGITKLLVKQVERAAKRGIGPDPDDESVIGSLDRFAIVTAETKFKAPSNSVPRRGIEKGELMKLLQDSRTALLEIVSKAGSYNLSELLFPHPVFGRINMYQWILFVGKHERRHTVQLEDLVRKIPASA
ncbi:MAG: DinB family protein [bacterium]|nr:DinB family protein [bacterium]